MFNTTCWPISTSSLTETQESCGCFESPAGTREAEDGYSGDGIERRNLPGDGSADSTD